MNPSLGPLVSNLEHLVTEVGLEEAATLLGDLERIRWKVRLRLEALSRGRQDGDGARPDQLLDVDEAASRLGCSTGWLYRHHGRLPFTVRNGRLLRFSSKGIDRFIRNREGR